MDTPHSFHIPVMGTGFTIDTPQKVARYGISSVISLVDDRLIERLREYYCNQYELRFVPIPQTDEDARARRITEYLNLVDRIVSAQIRAIRSAPFSKDSEITKYLEMLDDACALKHEYLRMLKMTDHEEKTRSQRWLREHVVAGSIDVNVMTKFDREIYRKGKKLPRESSDAISAVRGFANSELSSSIVLSAGLNLHVFTYLCSFSDFYVPEDGDPKKRVVLKVTDYRSALTQGKLFAKKGVWISEYRIESGLNCGGHAFAGEGRLIGPVLETFKREKEGLVALMYEIYSRALARQGRFCPSEPPEIRISAQGGIGTHGEHRFLIRQFELSEAGWGTPFLLVPEATTVDQPTLEKLIRADADDIRLSHSSPMGIPFYVLKDSLSEQERQRRIQMGSPGSPCLNQYASTNTEFSDIPICVSSRTYQKKKVRQLEERNLPKGEFEKAYRRVVEKACICRDLGDGVMSKYRLHDSRKKPTPAICPGPNLAYFSKICSLRDMIDHIYGRKDILSGGQQRSSLFVNEIRINLQYLKKLVSEALPDVSPKQITHFEDFRKNLLEAVDYYRGLAEHIREETEQFRSRFLDDLRVLREELESSMSIVLGPA